MVGSLGPPVLSDARVNHIALDLLPNSVRVL